MARDDRAGGADGVFEGLPHLGALFGSSFSSSSVPDHAAGAWPAVAQAFELSINGCHSWQLSLPLGLVRAYKPMYVCASMLASVLLAASYHSGLQLLKRRNRCTKDAADARSSHLQPANAPRPLRCNLGPRTQRLSQLQSERLWAADAVAARDLHYARAISHYSRIR